MGNISLKLKPLGGLAQIGANSFLVESENAKVIIDCGMLFPLEDSFGVSYITPNITELDKPDALLITHGHEDHVGGVCQFHKTFPDVPIYAPPFARMVIQKKFEYQKNPFKIIDWVEDKTLEFGELEVSPIHVNHSIPQTYGLFIGNNSEDTCMFFVSDFKVDHQCPYEKPFNFEKLNKLSSKFSKRILLSDSTNILSKELKTPGEGELIDSFDELFNTGMERYFVTTFSSNIHRVRTILNSAIKNNLKVSTVGRSVSSYIKIACELNIIGEERKALIDLDSLEKGKKNIVFIVSGCQGEFRSAMRRIVSGGDKKLKLTEKDCVIFSSKSIPGNGKTVSFLKNFVVESGASLVTQAELPVHVSGHAGKKDLEEVFSNFNPTYFIPIHGESYFLKRHQEFFDNKAETLFITNSDEIIFSSQGYKYKELEPLDLRFFQDNGVEVYKEDISERRKLAKYGSVFLSIGNSEKGPQRAKFKILQKGISNSTNLDEKIIHLAKNKMNMGHKGEDLEEQVRIAIRQYFNSTLGYKPLATVHVI